MFWLIQVLIFSVCSEKKHQYNIQNTYISPFSLNPFIFKHSGSLFFAQCPLLKKTFVKIIKESCLKTIGFWLKPANSLVFNSPDLKVGAIDVVVNKGFSPIKCFSQTFLDETHKPFRDYFDQLTHN